MEKYLEIERSLIKTYRKRIWGPFIRAINEYELLQDGDKIAVCISGGKDSFILAKCMQELKRHGKINFELEFIVMNPGYTKENQNKIVENAQLLNIPIHMFDSDVFEVAETLNGENPCYLCARMRRGYLYNKARELGCNKIALGHHFDDVIETILLSMLYSGEVKTMMPKLHSDNYEGMELIRPLYFVKENDIKTWVTSNQLVFLNCACKFTLESSIDEEKSKRKEMKRLIEQFRKTNPYIETNLFKSVYNVNLNTVIGYHKDGIKHHFLDEYQTKKNQK